MLEINKEHTSHDSESNITEKKTNAIQPMRESLVSQSIFDDSEQDLNDFGPEEKIVIGKIKIKQSLSMSIDILLIAVTYSLFIVALVFNSKFTKVEYILKDVAPWVMGSTVANIKTERTACPQNYTSVNFYHKNMMHMPKPASSADHKSSSISFDSNSNLYFKGRIICIQKSEYNSSIAEVRRKNCEQGWDQCGVVSNEFGSKFCVKKQNNCPLSHLSLINMTSDNCSLNYNGDEVDELGNYFFEDGTSLKLNSSRTGEVYTNLLYFSNHVCINKTLDKEDNCIIDKGYNIIAKQSLYAFIKDNQLEVPFTEYNIDELKKRQIILAGRKFVDSSCENIQTKEMNEFNSSYRKLIIELFTISITGMLGLTSYLVAEYLVKFSSNNKMFILSIIKLILLYVCWIYLIVCGFKIVELKDYLNNELFFLEANRNKNCLSETSRNKLDFYNLSSQMKEVDWFSLIMISLIMMFLLALIMNTLKFALKLRKFKTLHNTSIIEEIRIWK